LAVQKRILIVRTDRVGDVLLTTPLNAAIRSRYPDAQITWLVRRYTAPLLATNPDVHQVLLEESYPTPSALVQALKAQNFDAVIVSLPRWPVIRAIWQAGIPVRIGPASKLYSILLNKRFWQHRSRGDKHEADYNLELLQALDVPFKRFDTQFFLTDSEREQARKNLAGHRVSFQKPVVILHPGSGGSSERWPLTHFMELGDRLQAQGVHVVVTGGPGENYQNVMIDQMNRIPSFVPAGSVSLRELGALFSQVNLVVSNSTGPLHLAVAVGTPTVSVYSPIPTCHPRRWGPYPAYVEGNKRHQVFIAPEPGGVVDMAGVAVQDVLSACLQTAKA